MAERTTVASAKRLMNNSGERRASLVHIGCPVARSELGCHPLQMRVDAFRHVFEMITPF